MSASASSRTWQLQSCGPEFRVKERRKELCNKATEARHVPGVSLNGGLERPLHEAVKLKPGLPWRPQHIRHVRVLGYC